MMPKLFEITKYFPLLSLLTILPFTLSCEDNLDMECFPSTYRCGGAQGNILQYCESTSERWEYLRDCAERNQICDATKERCVFAESEPSVDGDEESNEAESPIACQNDFDCTGDSEQVCDAGECTKTSGVRFDLTTKRARLIYNHESKTLNLYDNDGGIIAQNLSAALEYLDRTGQKSRLQWPDEKSEITVKHYESADKLGQATHLELSFTDENALTFVWRISAYHNKGLTANIILENNGADDITILSAHPLRIDKANEGALFVGDTPTDCLILENGGKGEYDSPVRIITGDGAESVSNRMHLIANRSAERYWLLGALEEKKTLALIVASASVEQENTDEIATSRSFDFIEAGFRYEKVTMKARSLGRFEAGKIFIAPNPNAAKEALDIFTDALMSMKAQDDSTNKTFLDGVFWRPNFLDEETAINEAAIETRLSALQEAFGDWGLAGFVVPSGWETQAGDWTIDPNRFPDGGASLANSIQANGFVPAIEAAAFNLAPASDFAQINSEAILPLSTHDAQGWTLDPTHPKANELLSALGLRLKEEYGFSSISLIGGMDIFKAERFTNAQEGEISAFRLGLMHLLTGIGETNALACPFAFGSSLGLCGQIRPSLPVMATWSSDSADALGFKEAIRDYTRRYYLSRAENELSPGTLVLEDASGNKAGFADVRLFALLLAITSGIGEIQADITTLTPAEISLLRRFMPTAPIHATPLDLFEKSVPELWHAHIPTKEGTTNQPFELLAVFNWGENPSLSEADNAEDAETTEPKAFEIDLQRIGLNPEREMVVYEYRTEQTSLDENPSFTIDGKSLTVTVPEKDFRIFAIRNQTNEPQWLGGNRHLLLGANGLIEYGYNDWSHRYETKIQTAKVLSSVIDPWRLTYRIPYGWTTGEIRSSGVELRFQEHDYNEETGRLDLAFIPDETGELSIEIELVAP